MEKLRTIVLRGILRDRRGRFLLMQRAGSSKAWPGYWEFPGGKIEAGEEITAALRREFREETGLKVELGELYVAFECERETDRLIYLVYKVTSVSSDVQISPEHDAYDWYSQEDLRALKVSPPLNSVVQKLLIGEE